MHGYSNRHNGDFNSLGARGTGNKKEYEAMNKEKKYQEGYVQGYEDAVKTEMMYKEKEKQELLLGIVPVANKGQELIPHKDYEIKQEGKKFYLVKKKKEYPKTYKGCCDKLYRNSRHDECYEACLQGHPMQTFARLLICRDAYWKIAGEEIGLDKLWEPDWKDEHQGKWVITLDLGHIVTGCVFSKNHILAFPTEEMRDAFYENFKKEIKSVKELL